METLQTTEGVFAYGFQLAMHGMEYYVQNSRSSEGARVAASNARKSHERVVE